MSNPDKMTDRDLILEMLERNYSENKLFLYEGGDIAVETNEVIVFSFDYEGQFYGIWVDD
jgi:hypothetical protein